MVMPNYPHFSVFTSQLTPQIVLSTKYLFFHTKILLKIGGTMLNYSAVPKDGKIRKWKLVQAAAGVCDLFGLDLV